MTEEQLRQAILKRCLETGRMIIVNVDEPLDQTIPLKPQRQQGRNMDPRSGARFLLGLLVLGLVLYGCWLLLGAMHLPEPFQTVAMIILVLIGLGFLYRGGNWWGPGPPGGV